MLSGGGAYWVARGDVRTERGGGGRDATVDSGALGEYGAVRSRRGGRALSDPIAVVQDGAEDRWLRFGEPRGVVSTRRLDEVPARLAEVAERVESERLWAAGWVAYEAAPAFDPALVVRAAEGAGEAGPEAAPESGPPLLWFALFRTAAVHTAPLSASVAAPPPLWMAAPRPTDGDYSLGPLEPSVDRERHRDAVAEIRRRIAAGDTYQVNYTHRLRARFQGDPLALFRDLARAQRGRHAAFFDAGRHAVCSATPEQFFALDGRRLIMRPMKGTAPRGLTTDDDRRRVAALAASVKDRAENLMIVDMVRNDLGKVARPGSVAVPELFTVERYPTLLQMTSTVTAESDAPLAEIFAALFPCASITGAPKASTMGIIAEIEDAPRGVYTGAVGYIAPGRRARFGVAIRTAVADRERGELVYGVGGGIVWDSRADREWEECRLKAEVVTAALAASRPPWPDRFELLETLRWDPGEGFLLLDEHLARLAGSAEYFDFRCDLAAVRAALERAVSEAPVSEAEGGETTRPQRLRLRLDAAGKVRVDRYPLVGEQPRINPPEGVTGDEAQWETLPLQVALATEPIDPSDPFLFHKTTHRQVYEAAAAARPGCDEVLLWNRDGGLTEGTVSNLVIRRGEGSGARWVTPPVGAGLLAGTLRARLLADGVLTEEPIRVDDLRVGDALWLINSVRGWQRGELVVSETE